MRLSGVNPEIETINGIPLFDADLEANEGIPPPFVALKKDEGAASVIRPGIQRVRNVAGTMIDTAGRQISL